MVGQLAFTAFAFFAVVTHIFTIISFNPPDVYTIRGNLRVTGNLTVDGEFSYAGSTGSIGTGNARVSFTAPVVDSSVSVGDVVSFCDTGLYLGTSPSPSPRVADVWGSGNDGTIVSNPFVENEYSVVYKDGDGSFLRFFVGTTSNGPNGEIVQGAEVVSAPLSGDIEVRDMFFISSKDVVVLYDFEPTNEDRIMVVDLTAGEITTHYTFQSDYARYMKGVRMETNSFVAVFGTMAFYFRYNMFGANNVTLLSSAEFGTNWDIYGRSFDVSTIDASTFVVSYKGQVGMSDYPVVNIGTIISDIVHFDCPHSVVPGSNMDNVRFVTFMSSYVLVMFYDMSSTFAALGTLDSCNVTFDNPFSIHVPNTEEFWARKINETVFAVVTEDDNEVAVEFVVVSGSTLTSTTLSGLEVRTGQTTFDSISGTSLVFATRSGDVHGRVILVDYLREGDSFTVTEQPETFSNITGIAVQNGNSGDTVEVVYCGSVDEFSNLEVGKNYFGSVQDGSIKVEPPDSLHPNFIGIAVNAQTLFLPCGVWGN